MAKSPAKAKKNVQTSLNAPPAVRVAVLALVTALFFLAQCACSPASSKGAAMALMVLMILSVFFCFARLRERIGLPILALALVVVMGGISTQYAVAGKFALQEFLKVQASFCLALLLLAFAPGEGTRPGRWIATILSGCAALAGLVSIDLISTRWISGAVFSVVGLFSSDFVHANFSGVEAGVRMTSMFVNPNVFAGVMGIGVLLALGLVTGSEKPAERRLHLCLLYINALAFLLAFSMGASGTIAVAFLVFLLLARKGERAGLAVLMLETLVLVVIAVALVSMTSLDVWTGVRFTPLLCTVLGAAALVLLDTFVGRRVTQWLAARGRVLLILLLAVVVLLVAFVLVGYNLTGPADLDPGAGLRRAAYPEPGDYTLSVESSAPVSVTIESQNQKETMMHTSTILYQGDAASAAFTVPEDSLVVYFNFGAGENGARLERVRFSGAESGSVPLGYRLLPGFIANRLQGLFANENAIQRFVFFADGMKLFRRSPIFGLGLGAFENGIKGVQSFYYETKYAHNHYIQCLAETGVIGLLLFLALLFTSGAAVWLERRRGEEMHPLTPALGATLVFMAGHALTEVVFSSYAYLPMAFGAFALINLCCGGALKRPRVGKKVRGGVLISLSALTAAFGVLLGCNMAADRIVRNEATLQNLSRAVTLDKFEWADYALSYVNYVTENEVDSQVRWQANKYAERLAKVDSNTIPIYLARYYFNVGSEERGLAMIEKYVKYVSSDASAWQQAFDLLMGYDTGTETYRAGALRIIALLDEWNAENMGQITVSEEAEAFIARMRA